jgi:tetratricopeptide (TPR) repeat protein
LVFLLVAAAPASAVVPDSAPVAPMPEAPSAPPTLGAVIDLLKQRQNAAALKAAREFVKAQPGLAAGHEVHGFAAQVNGLTREAEAAYAEALRLEPSRVSVMVRLGQIALDTRDPKKAETWFRKAIAADPDLASPRRGLALALLRQRQLRPALAEANEALKRSGGKDLDAKLLIAQIYNDAGQPALAERTLTEVLTAAPNFVPALLLQGLVKLDLGKAAEAEALFDKVIEQDPKSVSARMGLAIVERSRGQLAKATTEMEAVAKERPEWAMAHLELGRTLLMQKQIDPALRAFDRAEQTSPDPAVTRVRVAQLLAAAGEQDRAIAKAQGAVGSTNAAPMAHALLARIYMNKGLPAQAEGELKKAVAAAPQNVPARIQLARFYRAQKRPAEGIAVLEEGVKAAPDNLELQGALLDVYVSERQADKAVALGERVRRAQGDTPAAYVVFAVINERVGRPAEALEAYQRALEKEPHFLLAARGRASLLARQQRPDEALKLLDETAAAHPRLPEPLMDMAQIEERRGNTAGAISAYRRALARAPENPLLQNNLAYLLSTDPATRDEAAALAEKALATAPGNPAITDTLGWILFQKGDLGRAEQLLSQAAKAAPGAADVRYHLGMVYAKLGKTEEARRELEAALKSPGFKSGDEARRVLETLK